MLLGNFILALLVGIVAAASNSTHGGKHHLAIRKESNSTAPSHHGHHLTVRKSSNDTGSHGGKHHLAVRKAVNSTAHHGGKHLAIRKASEGIWDYLWKKSLHARDFLHG